MGLNVLADNGLRRTWGDFRRWRPRVVPDPEIVTPAAAAMTRLQNIHAAAVELAERSPEIIANCGSRPWPGGGSPRRDGRLPHGAGVRAHGDRKPAPHDYYGTLLRADRGASGKRALRARDLQGKSASNRTLTTCCNEALGMTPLSRSTSREMHLARRALRQADALKTTVTAIATEHGFWDWAGSETVYRDLFGELPSVRSASYL